MSKQPTEYYVRLKPRPAKPRKGVARTPSRYMIDGVRFEEAKGWYRITDAAFAAKLRELTHNDRDDGVLIFDVASPDEAKAIQARERRSKTKREVEDAETQSVTPQARRSPRPNRSSAISNRDVRPEVEEPEPAMIDGADGDEDLEGGDDEAEALGKLEGGREQDLDDGDDLLNEGGREPRAPRVKPSEESAVPKTRKKAPAKKAAAKKS